MSQSDRMDKNVLGKQPACSDKDVPEKQPDRTSWNEPGAPGLKKRWCDDLDMYPLEDRIREAYILGIPLRIGQHE